MRFSQLNAIANFACFRAVRGAVRGLSLKATLPAELRNQLHHIMVGANRAKSALFEDTQVAVAAPVHLHRTVTRTGATGAAIVTFAIKDSMQEEKKVLCG